MLSLNVQFKYGKDTYQVTMINDLDGLDALKRTCRETGKEECQYHASKVLKSGKLSKTGGMFLRFKSGDFVKVL